jgi:uncharacterized membrane-anchored protein
MRTATEAASASGENVKAAINETVASWIESTWSYIQSERSMIIPAFLVWGIINTLNGSLDHIIQSDTYTASVTVTESSLEDLIQKIFWILSEATLK